MTPDTAVRKFESGGYYTIGKESYWFPSDLYKEAQDKDFSMPVSARGDREFSEWLIEFVKKHNLTTSTMAHNTQTLAGYWSKPLYKSAVTTDAKTIKFASVLKAMRSVVGVVDPSHKLKVAFAPTSTSYWDNTDRVYLPAEPVFEIKDTIECINTEAGFAVHEAFHSIETRKILDVDLIKYINPSQFKQMVVNIMEDVRIEDVLLRETPGYREYLKYAMEYLFSDDPIKELTSWDTGDLSQKMNALLLWTRYSDRDSEYLTHESFNEPRKWIKQWIKDYLDAQESNLTSLNAIEYTEKLRKYLGTTPEQERSVPMLQLPCTIHKEGAPKESDIDIALEEESIMYGEGTKAHKDALDLGSDMMRPTGSAHMRDFMVTRPRLGKTKFTGHKGNMIAKAKASLTFKKTQAQHDTRLQRNGILDEDELYRLMNGDLKIFKDAQVESLTSAAVYLLIDLSGSMGSELTGQAAVIAQVFAQALANSPAIKVKVLGHTGDNLPRSDGDPHGDGGLFYRIWESGEDLNRLGLITKLDRAENYDSWAIAWAGKLLLQEQVDQRLLVVLADGQPQATAYGGMSAQNHVRQVTDLLDRKGVFVVQVALGGELRSDMQDRMFKHWINPGFRGTRENVFNIAVKQLTQLLRRKML